MGGRFHDPVYTTICSEKTLQSNDKGFFMQFVYNTLESVGDDWIENVFGSLTNDNERLRILYEYEPAKSVIVYTLTHVQEIYRKNSADVSKARRHEAEKYFRNGDLEKSLMFYSQSVLRAPNTGENIHVDDGLSLTLSLWGRSEVLMRLGEYSLALRDIQTALKENITDKAEAFRRMGICYKAINELNRARVSFNIAAKLLPENELESLRNDIDKEYKENKHENRRVMPFVTKKHPDYPNATKKMLVKEEEGFGRFVVAKEHIKTGEVIVVEPPHASCLLPECFGTNCHHCFERLISPVGCPECSNVAFCKPECRDIALSSYHRFECKFIDLLIGSGMSILAHTCLRMITQNSLEKNLKIHENRSLEQVYSLCTNSSLRPPRDFIQRTIMAAFLLRILQKSGYFGREDEDNCIPTDVEFKIGELILFCLQMLQFNAHEIYETRITPQHRLRGSRASYIGVAIYPTVALFNHDCYPGVTRYFVGKNIVINAVRPISPGELIAENYGPVFTRRPLSDRQKSLSGRYWFTCQCTACTQDWPTYENGLETYPRKIRCPTQKCSYFFTLPVQNETMKCPRCKKKVSLTDNILQMKICEEQLQAAFELVETQEPEKGIPLLNNAIELFHKVSTPPHKDVHIGQEVLRSFLADSGNVHVCLKPYPDSE
ncbi:uncharacterized protein [Onthophagus taurus]|uniref:uncharacterized protein n=1 Tax=Onthophagus taurus TaxID=166361 RepID=UPI0039BE97DB